jgi:uncharacterized protein YhaN
MWIQHRQQNMPLAEKLGTMDQHDKNRQKPRKIIPIWEHNAPRRAHIFEINTTRIKDPNHKKERKEGSSMVEQSQVVSIVKEIIYQPNSYKKMSSKVQCSKFLHD